MKFNPHHTLLALGLLAALPALSYAFSLGHRVLVVTVTPTGDPPEKHVTLSLEGYGIPYDILLVPSTGIVGNASLLDSTGNPKYSLIVFAQASVVYNYGSAGYQSALTPDQWAYFEEYEIKFNVRRVSLDDNPQPAHGTSTVGGSGDAHVITLNSNFSAAAGLNTAPGVTTTGLWHYPATITNSSLASPVLYFEPLGAAWPDRTVGAVAIRFPNGREQMSFYSSFGWWSLTSLFCNHIWLQWGTRGLYQGYRRTFFTPQIDDVFLSTEGALTPDIPYRSSQTDMQGLIAWQTNLNSRLPAGSAFKIELVFNGNGILDAIDSAELINVDTEGYTTLDFKKPLGTGENRWPKSYKYSWSTSPQLTLSKDSLYAFFTSSTANRNAFNWVSHTFTHENLNNATTYDIQQEIVMNQRMASALGLSGQSYFSPNSMVTPQISGVFNGDVLKALTAANVNAIVGDNSRTNLIPTPVHTMYRSTLDSANYAGYAIIPRFPTEVYYHCSTVNENIAIYNMLYNTTLGISTWDQVLQREASRVLAAMMTLRHDPHMFHQANLRNADQPSVTINGVAGKWGLLQQWTESMLGQYKAMVNWPVVSVKMDTLAQYYREREAREACGISTSFSIANRTLSALTVTTTKACTVGVAVPPSSLTTRNAAYKYEQLSSVDPLTVWIPMKARQTVTLPLTKGVVW